MNTSSLSVATPVPALFAACRQLVTLIQSADARTLETESEVKSVIKANDKANAIMRPFAEVSSAVQNRRVGTGLVMVGLE